MADKFRRVLILLLLALVAGCGAKAVTSPSQIVKKAAEAEDELKSVQMKIDVQAELKNTPNDPQGTSTSYFGEGAYEQPDKTKMTLHLPSGRVEVITIGDKGYAKAPGSDVWTSKDVSGYQATGTTPGDIKEYLRYTEDLELIDQRGDTYHLGFKLDLGRYARTMKTPMMDLSTLKGKKARMEVWVLKDSFYVEKMKMDFTGSVTEGGAGFLNMSAEVDFSDFNEPVSIEAPI